MVTGLAMRGCAVSLDKVALLVIVLLFFLQKMERPTEDVPSNMAMKPASKLLEMDP